MVPNERTEIMKEDIEHLRKVREAWNEEENKNMLSDVEVRLFNNRTNKVFYKLLTIDQLEKIQKILNQV